MKKFYYGQSDDAYMELEDSVYEILENCIDILSILYDEDEYPIFVDFLNKNPVAKNVESIIRLTLTAEQYSLYKDAPLF